MRERVFGIETEYALIYHPARGEPERPTNLEIYGLFEQALGKRVRSVPRALSLLRAKTGRFLENGMSFHYEATPEHYEHGLLELASPECRDPFTLLCYERAKDELVEDLRRDVNQQLRAAGHRGEVRIGKNNVDSRGHTFGSHENYWIEDPLPPRERAQLLLLWAPLWLLTLPVLAWVVLLTPALLLMALLAFLLYGTGAAFVGVFTAVVRRVRPALARRFQWRTTSVHRKIVSWMQRAAAHPGDLLRRLNVLVAPLFPVLELHSQLLRRFVLLGIQRHFTAFLVTRTLFSGAGAVVFDGGPLLRLAQRPPYLRHLVRIFTSGDRRPVYEIRDFFFQPWSVLGKHRRLHLMIPDANLSEWAQVLRVGTAALVLEALESNASVAWPCLANPLESLTRLNRDPALEERLPLADGTSATAIEIQRRYLAGVRQALSIEPGSEGWKQRILRDWAETLDLLEHDPDALADRVDWIAKRRLLRDEIPDPADREILRSHGTALLAANPRDAESRRLRDIAYRARRVDLRYHELGPRGGYRKLRETGRTRTLCDPAAVAAAGHQPPQDTRARARGRAIVAACESRSPSAATWHRVRIGAFRWHWFFDPLDPGR